MTPACAADTEQCRGSDGNHTLWWYGSQETIARWTLQKRNYYSTGRTNSQPRGVCLYTCTLLSQLLILYQGGVCVYKCTLLSQLLTVYQGCVCVYTRVHCWVSCKHYISWFNLRTLHWLAWISRRLYFTTPFGVDKLSSSYRGSKSFDNNWSAVFVHQNSYICQLYIWRENFIYELL